MGRQRNVPPPAGAGYSLVSEAARAPRQAHRPATAGDGARFHGQEVSCSARYGFISTGASEIELIQPLTGRSPYTEFLEADGEGVHHLAYAAESADRHLAVLREAGEDPDVVFDGAVADRARFVYPDGLAHGPVVELIERVRQGG